MLAKGEKYKKSLPAGGLNSEPPAAKKERAPTAVAIGAIEISAEAEVLIPQPGGTKLHARVAGRRGLLANASKRLPLAAKYRRSSTASFSRESRAVATTKRQILNAASLRPGCLELADDSRRRRTLYAGGRRRCIR